MGKGKEKKQDMKGGNSIWNENIRNNSERESTLKYVQRKTKQRRLKT
jgi:hypothetical protein